MRSGRLRGPAGRRAISNIIAAVILVGMTVIAGVVLWAYRPPLPPAPASVDYQAVGNQSEPAWGDPTDCSNTTIYAKCGVLPAVDIVVVGHSPASIPLSQLSLTFMCNGTVLLNGSLQALEVVPGSGASPGRGSPTLGVCGTWSPNQFGFHSTFFNRLMFFKQIQVGSPTLASGDVIVIYGHPPGGFHDYRGNAGDNDDFHGAPAWCFSVPGACTVYLSLSGSTAGVVATIPLLYLAA